MCGALVHSHPGASQRERCPSQVLLAAGDTFRAAAAEQLQTWADRAGADFYGPKRERHRPDALLYEVRCMFPRFQPTHGCPAPTLVRLPFALKL